jgi:hypothetical protein
VALLRLLAFALMIAVPFQGFAASTCLCRLHDTRSTSAGTPRVDAGQALQGAAQHAITGKSSTPSHSAKTHAVRASCSMNCCQASVAASVWPDAPTQLASTDDLAYLPLRFVSWAEPVPHGPPRS